MMFSRPRFSVGLRFGEVSANAVGEADGEPAPAATNRVINNKANMRAFT
jgi:hypothetical protein